MSDDTKNPNLKPWKPGESGNPSGRPKLPEELKQLRKLTKKSLQRLGEALITSDVTLIEKYAEEGTGLERWICKVILNGIKTGDMGNLSQLLIWLVGKPVEEIQVTHPKPTVIEFRDGRQIVLGTKEVSEDED